jgi:hypothetical protein
MNRIKEVLVEKVLSKNGLMKNVVNVIIWLLVMPGTDNSQDLKYLIQ